MELSCRNASLLFLPSLFFIVFCFCFAFSSNETDLQALLQFKSGITHDPLHVFASWNDSIHFCQFHGVTCSRRHDRVTMLNLPSSRISGSISPYIGNLSFIRSINLENNSFSNEIPAQIGYLTRMEQLRLNNNSLRGKVPTNISKCSKLIVLRLGFNRLQGNVPEELGTISNLQVLSVPENDLTGNIPYSLGNLSQLGILSVAVNGLIGQVPDALGQLRNLKSLFLRSNHLSGNIPLTLFNLSSLRELDIGQNHFRGELPSDSGLSLRNIQRFVISSNEFTGKIPASFSNATSLDLLLLLENHLFGPVPSLAKLNGLRAFSLTSNNFGTGKIDDLNFLHSLTNASGLEQLSLNGNYFGGLIPGTIGNLSDSLRVLLLDNNRITGRIPPGIENLVGLEDFELWNNKLSGPIPDSIGKLQNLIVLALNNNTLSGDLPPSLGNLTNIIQLLVEENNLSGRIPSDLGRCENLLGLDLSENNFNGSIPTEVLSLSSLSIYLDLSQNRLTGNLAMEVGNLKNLGEFDVSGNELSGQIPSTLSNCISLEILHIDSNNFQGLIPSSLRSLRALQILDLSDNNLSGTIPEFLSDVKLQYLNLSYNNFEGMVPAKGIFENASATSVEGNKMLCGGIPEFQLPACNSQRHKNGRLTRTMKIIIGSISMVGVALVFCLLLLLWFRRKEVKETTDLSEKKLMELPYQALFKATDGFSSVNMIGMGSFGSVYKGKLEREGILIAVKVFNLSRRGAFKSFLSECEALRNARHRNLVKVLTVCSSLDYQGNEFKALVYEFMMNGNLEEWLHIRNEGNLEIRKLNILQRLNIAIDIACALDYLHHHCEPHIIHCDLKPSNILLDEDLTGHVGDFGLARFLVEATNDRSNQSSSIGVRGTVGYAPPEYGMGNEISTHGDVYSFGILLLEMFTGERPTDEKFKDLNLHNFVKAALPDRASEILDPNLVLEIKEAETSIDSFDNERCSKSHDGVTECLNEIFQVGVNCSVELPGERMGIVDVARILISVKDKIVGSGIRPRETIADRIGNRSG